MPMGADAIAWHGSISGCRAVLTTFGGVTTIEDLDGQHWPDPTEADTELVRRCLTLRRKDLDDFTVEDLRITFGQRMAVPILLPVAVKVLIHMSLTEGDTYPGDLLHAVLRLPSDAWRGLADVRRQVLAVVKSFATSDDLDDPIRAAIHTFVGTAGDR
jgi:CDI immunity proteins